MWLTRVAGQDQAAATRSQLPRHGWGVLIRCVSTNGMVTTAIEKECKGSIQVRQMEHIGDHEMHLNPGGVSAFFRLLHGQRSQVDAGYLKALLGQPDTIEVPQRDARGLRVPGRGRRAALEGLPKVPAN